MRFLVASDLHGSASKAALFLEKVREMKPEAVLLLGDLLYHGPRNPLPDKYNPQEVISVLSKIEAPIIAVRGNCDAEVDQLVLPFPLMESAWVMADGKLIMAVHGHHLPENLDELKAAPGTIIMSGHTHIPLAEKSGAIYHCNPGSTSLPKDNYPPSFGFYDNGLFQVLDFQNKLIKELSF